MASPLKTTPFNPLLAINKLTHETWLFVKRRNNKKVIICEKTERPAQAVINSTIKFIANKVLKEDGDKFLDDLFPQALINLNIYILRGTQCTMRTNVQYAVMKKILLLQRKDAREDIDTLTHRYIQTFSLAPEHVRSLPESDNIEFSFRFISLYNLGFAPDEMEPLLKDLDESNNTSSIAWGRDFKAIINMKFCSRETVIQNANAWSLLLAECQDFYFSGFRFIDQEDWDDDVLDPDEREEICSYTPRDRQKIMKILESLLPQEFELQDILDDTISLVDYEGEQLFQQVIRTILEKNPGVLPRKNETDYEAPSEADLQQDRAFRCNLLDFFLGGVVRANNDSKTPNIRLWIPLYLTVIEKCQTVRQFEHVIEEISRRGGNKCFIEEIIPLVVKFNPDLSDHTLFSNIASSIIEQIISDGNVVKKRKTTNDDV